MHASEYENSVFKNTNQLIDIVGRVIEVWGDSNSVAADTDEYIGFCEFSGNTLWQPVGESHSKDVSATSLCRNHV